MQALDGKDVKEMLLNVGSGGGAAAAAPAAGGASAAAAGGAGEEEAEKEEEKAEGTTTPALQLRSTLLTFDTEKEESDEDMGFGLFD